METACARVTFEAPIRPQSPTAPHLFLRAAACEAALRPRSAPTSQSLKPGFLRASAPPREIQGSCPPAKLSVGASVQPQRLTPPFSVRPYYKPWRLVGPFIVLRILPQSALAEASRSDRSEQIQSAYPPRRVLPCDSPAQTPDRQSLQSGKAPACSSNLFLRTSHQPVNPSSVADLR